MSRTQGTHNSMICRDPRLPEIETARAKGLSLPAMAGRFWVKADALRHHFTRVEQPAEGGEPREDRA